VHGGSEEDWKVVLAETGEETMTGGRVAAIRKYVENDELFCLTYGDGVSDLDITKLLSFHRAHGKACTVTAVRPPGRFGEMRLTGDQVAEFNEKPQTTEGFINGGFFVCDSKRIWDFIPNQKKLTLEQEPMRDLSEKDQLQAFRHTGFWQPMDTLREFTMLNNLWSSGKAPWKSWKDGP
jgi:glucose-1-phosphate cytidylyltransferase